MSPRRDVKQFRAASREAGIVERDEYEAMSAEFHAEKRSFGERDHRSYGELLAWMQQWKASHDDDD